MSPAVWTDVDGVSMWYVAAADPCAACDNVTCIPNDSRADELRPTRRLSIQGETEEGLIGPHLDIFYYVTHVTKS